MLSELMKRVQDYFEPYTLQKFIADHNPQSNHEIERLEKLWQHYVTAKGFTSRY